MSDQRLDAVLNNFFGPIARGVAQEVSGISAEHAAAILGLAIGNEATQFSTAGTRWSSDPVARKILNICRFCIDPDRLIENSDFTFGLRLAAEICYADELEKGVPWRSALEEHLTHVLPLAVARECAATLVTPVSGNIRVRPMPSRAEIEAFVRRVYHIALGGPPPSPDPVRPSGNASQMVPCPSCGTPKRCFANTKKFRCTCGFDQPYPFSLSR